MLASDLSELKDLLIKRQSITPQDLNKILILIEDNHLARIVTKPRLIRTTADKLTERDFMKFIRQNIIFYVLNYGDYKEQINKKNEDRIRETIDLYLKARQKFQKKSTSSGEAGELILFLLLECDGASQIISKMRLKTGNEWPFFGVDAIHLEVSGDNLVLHYGESKMRKTFDIALRDAVATITEFEENDKQNDDEVDLISAHIDDSKFEKYTSQIVDLFGPYSENKKRLAHKHSVFLGFDWDLLKNPSSRGEKNLMDYVTEEFLKSRKEFDKKITSVVTSSKVKDGNYWFYLIPFANEEKFRQSFNEEL